MAIKSESAPNGATVAAELDDRAFRRGALVALIGASGGYALYRIIETGAEAAIAPAIPLHTRLPMSLADGALMAAAVPIAIWASRRFPVDRLRWASHLVAHLAIGIATSFAWIVAMHGAARVIGVATTPLPSFPRELAWLTSNLFAYAALVASVHALAFQRQARARELHAVRLEAQLAEAQLAAIRVRIHPHFLFNVLNALSEMIHVDPAGADEMVGQLARLMRRTLEAIDTEWVSLGWELDLASDYLALHSSRLGDRLSVHIDVSPTLREARVPPLILQPLVENAIRHGIEPRRAPSRLTITAFGPDGAVEIVIQNDGARLPTPVVEGLGLRITRQRLDAAFGGAGSLALSTTGDGVTVATLRMPIAGRRAIS